MSKKYKGKPCVYCGVEVASGADHVFARKLFLPRHRDNLPKVPACDACNRRKADLERYVTTVLPLAGRHPSALENLRSMVPPRLDKNPAIYSQIKSTMRPVLTTETGTLQETGMFSLDWELVEQLFVMITRGLMACHYGQILAPSDEVQVSALNPSAAQLFETQFFASSEARVRTFNLGNGTVVYQAVQAMDCPRASVWRFAVYGGTVMADSSGDVEAIASTIGVITCPPTAEAAGLGA